MKSILHSIPIVVVILLSILPLAHGSCIPQFPLWIRDNFGNEVTKDFFFDGSTDIIQEVDKLVAEQHLDREFRTKILEAIIKHVAAFSFSRDVERGAIFMQMQDKSTTQRMAVAVANAVHLLPSETFPSRVWSTVSSPPFQIVLDGRNEYMTHMIMGDTGYWIYDQVKMLVNAARDTKKSSSGVVVDVGANLGIVSLYAAALGERVAAFEATPQTAHRLKASCVINGWCSPEQDSTAVNSFSRNNRFAIFENALSHSDGEDITMRVNWHNMKNVTNAGANSMFKVDGESDSNCVFETVKSITLDTALTSLGLLPEIGSGNEKGFQPKSFISVLKMDCEGCEPGALLGASRLFRYNSPLSMMVEINDERLKAAGIAPFDFVLKIENLGYNIVSTVTNSLMSPVSEQAILKELEGGDFDILALLKSSGWRL